MNIKLQQLLWSGSVPTLRNPSLISKLNVIANIKKFNRIYLPASVFSFDSEHPLETIVNLPQLVTDDESDRQISRNLVLTRRVFYRAFGGELYEEAMDVAINYSKAADLFFVARSSLVRPLYPSKSMIIAANLLNMLFDTLLSHMHIPNSEHADYLESFCNAQPGFGEEFETNKAASHGVKLLAAIFPENLGMIKPSLQETSFVDLWKYAIQSLPAINTYVIIIIVRGCLLISLYCSTLKWSNYARFRKGNEDLVDVQPTLSAYDISRQMTILLHQMGLKWIPTLGTQSFVLKHRISQKFVLTRFVLPFKSSVLENFNVPNGQPLPHPVDGSFVHMVISKMVKKMILSKDKSDKWSAKELLGHLLYHYTKIDFSDHAPAPEYKSIKKQVLLASKLLTGANGRGFHLLSLNNLYFTYLDLEN